jgi:hypothetical protein
VSFGPLLDAPSAVGDEGRPRATSLTVVSFVLAALVTAVGYRLGQWDLLASLGVVTGLAAAGLALLDRRRFVHRFFGHALLTWFGMPLAGLVVLAPFIGRPAVAVAGAAVALFGLTATWSDTGDRRSLRRGLYAVVRTTVATVLWLTLGLLVAGVGVVLVRLPPSSEPSPTAALVGFCGVLAAASAATLVGLRWLPLRRLAPRPRRARVGATVRRLQVATGALLAAAVVLGGVATLAPNGGGGGIGGLLAVVAPALASQLVVGAVVSVAGTVFLAGTLARTARAVARRGDPDSSDRLAAALAGLPLSALVVLAVLVDPLFGLVVLAAVLGGQLLLLLGLSVGLGAGALGVVPDRTGAPATTAAGLLLAAVALAPTSALLAAACVAAACLSWDLSTFGLGVTAELGHRPRIRRLVFVHGLLSVGVGSLAVLAVAGLARLQGAVAGDAFPAVVVATGALLVVATVRG